MNVAASLEMPMVAPRPLVIAGYNEAIVRRFVVATVLWALFGFSIGVIIAAQLALLPRDKLAMLARWRKEGRRVLMVGDGLNDAPALAGAEVSASFTHGAPASQSAADIVLPADRLSTVVTAWKTARRAVWIIHQNLGLAALYNIALIPVAMTGLVTPLGAAIAMATSSLTVTLNALRAGAPRTEHAS